MCIRDRVYTGLEKKGTLLYEGMKDLAEKAGLTCHLNHISSLGSIFFTEEKVCDYTSAKTSDTKAFANYFLSMLKGSTGSVSYTHLVFSEVLEKGNLYE